MKNTVKINRLVTGIAGLDDLLGGGIPEFSFNLLAGTPGSGKTTLAHQIMFSLASRQRRSLFFTVLGEPPLKILRYQQQFTFFDAQQVNQSIKFVNLAADIAAGDLDRVLARITEEVRLFSPGLVFIDSFRSMVQAAQDPHASGVDLQYFVQQLGVQMTSWLATTFLIGEYQNPETESGAVFTVADGIIWMSQLIHRDALVRKIQVIKMRGQAQSLGAHTFRITEDGITIFPRAMSSSVQPPLAVSAGQRLSIGVAELDTMLGGGVPVGYSVLLVGPSGSGKSVLANQFLAEGVRMGEKGVLAAFEKSPNQLLNKQLNAMIEQGQVGVINTRTLDLSIDEILHDLVSMIERMQAKRVVIDSLSGFELALASSFRADFRESLYRMVSVLTGLGLTVLMTAELEDRYETLRFSAYGNAFLADAIVMQRYIELSGELQRVISVIKVRASAHSKAIHFYEIHDEQLVIGKTLSAYTGILTGQPASSVLPR